jgi:diguanylate cyclase (GGDEF)-like protein
VEDAARIAPTSRSRQQAARRLPGVALRLALLLLLVAAAGTTHAAALFGQDDGLPGVLVEAIEPDEQGLLWIGTQDGLVRFDSHRFVAVDLARGAAVPDRHVRRLLAVPGALYAATPSRLVRIDLATQQLRAVQLDGRDIAGVWGLLRRADGGLFAGTDNGELLRWRDAGADAPRVERVALRGDEELPGIVQLAAGRDALWAATLRGVFRLDPDAGRHARLRLPLPALADGAVHARAVHEAEDGELWLGFWNDGLVRHDPRDGRTRWLRPGTPEAGALRSSSIYAFLETPRGLYIGTNRGLVMRPRDCDCLRGLNHPSWDAVDGRGVVVADLAAEGHGVWAGVWGGGAVRFGPTDEAIERQVRIDGRADSLAHPMVYALHAGPDGRLWIGSYGGGVQWVDAAQRTPGAAWPLQALPPLAADVESQLIWTLHEHDGALVVGSGRGLFAWRDGAPRAIAPQLPSLRSYLPLAPGRALVGTMFGLFEHDAAGIVARPLGSGEGSRAAGTAVWSLLEHEGELWVGTAQGLLRLDRALREQARHPPGAAPAQLPGAVVWTQRHDAGGAAWLGTSGGLVQAARAGGGWQFERHPLPAGFGSHSIVSLEFDRRGRLWLGTPQGLVRYDPRTRAAERFDRRDGLVSDQLNVHASASDGERLYFGGMGGVVAFDPERLVRPTAQLLPGVVRWRLGDGAWQAAGEVDLELSHDHAPLQLELTARHFARPDQVRYAYRWVPLEDGFTALGDARSAVFSRLPSGRHTLELRAQLLDDAANAVTVRALALAVAPPWHETLWGRGGLLGALAALVWAAYWLRTRQTRRWARGLAHEVRERTRELTEARDALQAANQQLQRQVALDPLTGLANRRGLFESAAALDSRGVPLAAMLIDLDHFKAINDAHGHQAGDVVLQDFAALLREVLPEALLHARYGGEEFVCLLGHGTEPALAALAARLLEALRGRRVEFAGGEPLAYRASIGLAAAVAGESSEALLRRADHALYRAKQAGRDRSAFEPPPTSPQERP